MNHQFKASYTSIKWKKIAKKKKKNELKQKQNCSTFSSSQFAFTPKTELLLDEFILRFGAICVCYFYFVYPKRIQFHFPIDCLCVELFSVLIYGLIFFIINPMDGSVWRRRFRFQSKTLWHFLLFWMFLHFFFFFLECSKQSNTNQNQQQYYHIVFD